RTLGGRRRDVGLADVQAVARLIRQHPFFNGSGWTRADLRCLSLLFCLVVAACEAMPHISRGQDDQGNKDDPGQRTEFARLWGETAIDATHNLIGLCGASDLVLTLLCALLGSRTLKIERLGILACDRHTQLLFPVLPE